MSDFFFKKGIYKWIEETLATAKTITTGQRKSKVHLVFFEIRIPQISTVLLINAEKDIARKIAIRIFTKSGTSTLKYSPINKNKGK